MKLYQVKVFNFLTLTSIEKFGLDLKVKNCPSWKKILSFLVMEWWNDKLKNVQTKTIVLNLTKVLSESSL
jgi:hypothetical protein